MEMTWTILFLIFALLVLVDKGLTMANIIQVNKNFPEAMKSDHYKIEKNPIAKYMLEKFGLVGGTIIMIFVSFATLLVAYGFLRTFLSVQVSLYGIFLVYGFVIINNFYFLLKYSAVIP